MITPVNGHLLIEPLVKEEFVSSTNEKFQEIGMILATPENWRLDMLPPAKIGDKVYFDAWLAAKFPSETIGEYYWLVKWEDIRAIEYAKSE